MWSPDPSRLSELHLVLVRIAVAHLVGLAVVRYTAAQRTGLDLGLNAIALELVTHLSVSGFSKYRTGLPVARAYAISRLVLWPM